MEMSQKQIYDLSKKIAAKTKSSKFSNSLVIEEVLTLLTKQKPCYSEFEFLGKGGSALVLKADINGFGSVALKIVEFDECNEKEIQAAYKMKILESLQVSEYILKQNDCFFLTEEKKNGASTDSNEQEEEKKNGNVGIVNRYFVQDTELCQGSFAEYLAELREKSIQLEDSEKILLVVQMLDAVNFLHQQDIIISDIQPSNFLYKKKEGLIILKLRDFGFTQKFDFKSGKNPLYRMGNPGYTAPEVWEGQSQKESDLYSIGIIILEIDNSPIFNVSKITPAEFGNLQQGLGIFPKQNLNTLSTLYQLASISLKPKFQDRTTAQQLLLYLLQQEHNNLRDIQIYSKIFENQLHSGPFFISQFSYNGAQQQGQLNQIPISFCPSEETMKIIIDELLISYSKQENKSALTEDQVKGALRAVFKIGDFQKFELIGAGSEGVILGGLNERYLRQSALKICLVNKNKADLLRQIDILKQCQMPKIVKFYGYQFIKDEDNNEYIVFEMERCLCSLLQYLNEQRLNNKLSPPEERINLSIQMIDGVNYLHELNILHRDIKLDNYLISKNEKGEIEVKLSDFDHATQLQENYEWNQSNENHDSEQLPPYSCAIIQHKLGTIPYYAPERNFALKPCTKKTDSFSVGLCLLVLDNYLTFSEDELVKKQLLITIPYTEPFEGLDNKIINRNSQIYEIAQKLLTYQPSKRSSLSKILEDTNLVTVQVYSRQTEYPFNMNFLESICYFKIVQTKQKLQLEQILHQMSFLTSLSNLSLNFSNNLIGELGVQQLSPVLSKLTNLSSLTLDLSFNQIKPTGASYLSNALNKLTKLSSINLQLCNNSLKELGAKQISTIFSKLPNLFNIILNFNCNSIGEEGVNWISNSLSKCTYLSNLALFLYSNKIGESGALYLSTSFSSLSNLMSLTLDLDINQIEVEGANYMATALSNLLNLESLTMKFRGNLIKEAGANILSSISSLTNLSNLMLDLDNYQICKQAENQLSKSLLSLPKLTSLALFLKDNQLGENGAYELSTILIQLPNLSSVTLDLDGNLIGEQGAHYISLSLYQLPNLLSLNLTLSNNQIGEKSSNKLPKIDFQLYNLSSLYLDLRNNQISKQCAYYLNFAIFELTNLTRLTLNFSKNNLGNDGVQILSEGISQLTNISSLNLDFENNSLKESGTEYLSVTLKKFINLQSLTLYLSSNQIGDLGTKYLSSALPKLINLSYLQLDIRSNYIGDSGATFLSTAVFNLPSLQSLTLYLRSNSIKEPVANSLKTTIINLNLKYESISLDY